MIRLCFRAALSLDVKPNYLHSYEWFLGEYFWIDNDSFEACPIEVSVLKDAVNSFPLAEDYPTSIVPPCA
ncbi:hypothetical protein ECG_03845 [Echinococcus granulosus]|uniref:Expressed protein n=1 Tax=Echinococcus granulosus TaxID=6210 RepID=A0A068WJV3_ECHGR|nr:hypothetical protein ECG_03845 [Echinococcus granulosus]CDS17884.1 expressed protein [Echinococcus granulosus]